MERLLDFVAIFIIISTILISFYFRSLLLTIERLFLWIYCVVYLAVFIHSALDLQNPIWLRYGARTGIILAFVDLCYRLRRRRRRAN